MSGGYAYKKVKEYMCTCIYMHIDNELHKMLRKPADRELSMGERSEYQRGGCIGEQFG